MKMLFKFYLNFSILILCGTLSAQPWMKMLPKNKNLVQNTDFYDIQKAFNQY